MAINKTNTGKYKLEIYPDGRNGKRIRRTFDTKAEALRFERHTLITANNDPWNPKTISDNRTLSELAKRYDDLHVKTLADRTNQMRYLTRVINHLGDPVAKDLTKNIYSEYIATRRHDGSKQSTLNTELIRIKSMFNKLHELNEIQYECPIKALKPLKLDESEKTYLELPSLKILMDALESEDKDCYLTAKLCASTGARWGEAQNMESNRVKKHNVYYTKTKTARNRTVGISEEFYEELPKSRGRLFADTYMKFLNVFHELKLDVPKGQATHILRHTFATHYMKNGGNILDLRVILGHSKIEMTMIYAHHSPSYTHHATTLNPICFI